MRLPVNNHLPHAALFLLAACGGGAPLQDTPLASQSPYGPAGDYPVVIGPAYSVGGVTYSPSDTMNYDVVGRASVGSDGGAGVTAAHHTLPLPSYVELTALDTGKTILVRVERRGPMIANNVIELSPGAADQLGVSGQPRASVRVRRVNPIEPERAILRTGQAAPARMDTPKSLLTVLQRKLDNQEGVVRAVADIPANPVTVATPTPNPGATAPKPKPAATPAAVVASKPTHTPKPAPAVAPRARYYIQVGAFSNEANAKAAAARTGGNASQAGKFWRVRMGPYASDSDTKAALAKARAAGYSDARIQSAN